MVLLKEHEEVKFDAPFREMKIISGEKVLDKLENIEDSKGNGGERGRLIITNIRMIWYSTATPRVNLAIGFGSMVSLNPRMVNSKIRGATQALHILTESEGAKYEFIFTNLVPGNLRHFTSVLGVYKAYNSSKLYRELKLRGAVIYNKQLKLLPMEQVFSTLHGIWNLSSDQGSVGTFTVTNVRIVWYADMNDAFNISLPFLRIENISIRDSKFGTALVVVSTETSGGYILGFKVDPNEKLKQLYKELTSLHTIYTNKPIFGVEYKLGSNKNEQENHLVGDYEEIDEIKGEEMPNTIAAYLADDGHVDRSAVLSSHIGLAIENIKDGYTLQTLWEVILS